MELDEFTDSDDKIGVSSQLSVVSRQLASYQVAEVTVCPSIGVLVLPMAPTLHKFH